MTINRDYFKGLKHFAKLFPDNIPRGRGLVYSGEEAQRRMDIAVVPYQHVDDLFSSSDDYGER